MTISQMVSLTNKYPAFVFLISVLPLIPFITLSHFAVVLTGSTYPLIIYSGSLYTCRIAHLPFPFNLILLPHQLSLVATRKSLSLVPSFQFLHNNSQLSNQLFHHLILYADDTQLFISFIPNTSQAISDLQSTASLISS